MPNIEQEFDTTLFDMDGVIIDSEKHHVAAEQQTCVDYGFDIDPDSWGGFKGSTANSIFSHLILNHGDPAKHDVESLITHKTELFIDLVIQHNVQAIPGAIDLMSETRERTRAMGLVTSSNSRVQEFVVEYLDIAHLLDFAVNGDDVVNGKPDPEPYQLGLQRAKSEPSKTLVAEDSKNGIASGRAAGCFVVAVTTSHPAEELVEAKPHLIAEDYATIWPMIDGLQPPSK